MKKIFLLIAALVFSISLSSGSLVQAQGINSLKYVSLGDSIAAGAGLPLTDMQGATKACGRSSQSYPYLVAATLNTNVEHIACGGATVPNGLAGPQQAGSLMFAPQIDQAFSQGTPDIITLTVGSNDIRWSDVIRKCYVTTCGTWEDTIAVAQLEKQLYQNLKSALQRIKDRSNGHAPKLILTGYFQPLSNDQPACADTQGLTREEINWIRVQDYILNGILSGLAWQFNFVKFAPVNFDGHELCSNEPWIQGFSNPAPYHPTAEGQKAIARAVQSRL